MLKADPGDPFAKLELENRRPKADPSSRVKQTQEEELGGLREPAEAGSEELLSK